MKIEDVIRKHYRLISWAFNYHHKKIIDDKENPYWGFPCSYFFSLHNYNEICWDYPEIEFHNNEIIIISRGIDKDFEANYDSFYNYFEIDKMTYGKEKEIIFSGTLSQYYEISVHIDETTETLKLYIDSNTCETYNAADIPADYTPVFNKEI